MGQIVKRKKKGRPSKADLARRAVGPAPLDEQEIRRSRRHRNVRYDVDYDDYLDEEEDDDLDAEENAKRREKKLKLVLKLPNEITARQDHALEPEASVSANEYGNHRRTKRRKMDDGDVDEDIDEIDKADEEGYDGTDEERGRKLDAKFHGSVPGTPAGSPLKIPMRDRKTLELILDTLQKKDIYGVYAEPVDPEELPDYHDVIEHPMDFSTVRKKLTNGLYSTLEQFESDVFLICTNAMQYNSEDTIYYKQARSIQELARKRFQKLRDDFERELKSERKASEKELNLEHNTDERDFRSEQKTSSDPLTKKQTKKSNCWTSQEPVGSDFSSGATLATVGDAQNGLNSIHAGNSEKHGNIDMSVEGGFTLTDGNIEKTEDLLLGRGLFLKYGKKSYTVDESRRSTYNLSSQLVLRPESIFTTFECESKQLVAVGLHAEYSYARSVARFAATLGPLAWKVASKRIEQALPAGFKFGHGWVGEYEPLPSPVLLLQSRAEKEQSPLTKPPASTDPIKNGRNSNALFSPNVLLPNGTTSEGILPSWVSSASGANTPEGKLSLFSATENKLGPVNNIYQQPNPLLKTGSESHHKVSRQVELNRPPSADQHIVDRVAENQASKKPEMVGPGQVRRGLEMQSPGQLGTVWRNGHNLPFRKPDSNGLVVGGLPNGKVDFDGRLVTSLSDSVPQVPDHCLSDPVKLMRALSEKAQRQQNSSPSSPIDAPPSTPSVPLSNNAAAAAARAWMSVGAGNLSVQRNPISAESLYNPAREQLHSRFRGEAPIPGVPHFHADKKRFPGPQSFPTPNGPQVQNRPTMFPQFVAGDFSRFQAQSPWQVLGPQTQLKPKQDSFPPDLNIGFPPSGSPGRRVDNSQQPDLALQL